MFKYVLKCWIPTESEADERVFDDWNEAMREKIHSEFLQPENIYQIVRKDGDE